MNRLIQDLQYALRQFSRTPAITAVVVITLALGIGVNTGIFSVLNGWLFRPLPVPAPERILVVASQQEGAANPNFSCSDFLDFRKQAQPFSELFAYAMRVGGLSADGQASEFAYSAVSGNYFSALGVKPALGRLFLPGEGENAGEGLKVVLGYSFWQTKFAGDSHVVGRAVLVNGKSATVIGVTSKGFRGVMFSVDMNGYLPLSMLPLDKDSSTFWTDRRDRQLSIDGRLGSGVSLAQAQGSMNLIASRLAAQYPATNQGLTARVIPERLARPAPAVASFVPIIATLFLALAGIVLVLACVNVASLLLARAVSRHSEMAIRSALGAGRGRLVRQMLTESLILALLGGFAGVVLGEWAISLSGTFLQSATKTSESGQGFALDSSFDWRIFAYTSCAAVLAGILVGLWPALRVVGADVGAVLHEGGREQSGRRPRQRLRSLLTVAQVAGSVMLLIVTGLLVRSLGHAEHMYLGFEPDHVLNVMLDPHQIGWDQTRTKNFYQELKQRARSLPGVESVSIASTVPLGMPAGAMPIHVEEHPVPPGQPVPELPFNSVDPEYFTTMRIPLLAGRTFTDFDDGEPQPVAIVNQSMARRFWPNEDPIGKRFSTKSAIGPFVEVVGLARDGQSTWRLSTDVEPYFYLPLAQNYVAARSLLLRSSVPPESLIPEVRKQIRGSAPDLPIFDMRTMQQAVNGLTGLMPFRIAAYVAAILGLLGLTLALVGVYGVVSFAVSRRTHEIGIRMALGAGRRDILRLVSRQSLSLVIAGVLLGLFAAWGLTRAMAALLVGTSASDPLTYGVVAILLTAVALLACWVPARRAAKVDPMVALRYE